MSGIGRHLNGFVGAEVGTLGEDRAAVSVVLDRCRLLARSLKGLAGALHVAVEQPGKTSACSVVFNRWSGVAFAHWRISSLRCSSVIRFSHWEKCENTLRPRNTRCIDSVLQHFRLITA